MSMAPKHNVNVVIPRAGRLPSDASALLTGAVLTIAPSRHDDRILRADMIHALIAGALASK